MRISDWSSDVCSSDLAYAITLPAARAFLRACATVKRPVDDQMDRSWEHGVRNLALFPSPVIEEFVESGIGSVRYNREKSEVYRAPRQRLARLVDRQRIRWTKIGRASYRDRGCQYV